MARTVFSKEQKRTINKRVERLKQQQRIDDMTELNEIGELMSGGKGKKLFASNKENNDKKDKKDTKNSKPVQTKKSAWQKNVDEEKYDSKRQAKMRQSGKIKHKKKGKK